MFAMASIPFIAGILRTYESYTAGLGHLLICNGLLFMILALELDKVIFRE